MGVIPDAQSPLAAVRPRVLPARGEGSEPTLLTEVVARWLERGKPQGLHLVGGRGSGRSTALAYVAREFGRHPALAFADESPPDAVEHLLATGARPIWSTVWGASIGEHAERWEERYLAPWTPDDRIEYALARYPASSASILRRCAQAPDWLDLEGSPLLWSAVIDALAADEQLYAIQALAKVLDAVVREHPARIASWDEAALAASKAHIKLTGFVDELGRNAGCPRTCSAFLAQPTVRQLMVALMRASEIARGLAAEALSSPLDRKQLHVLAWALARSEPPVRRLQQAAVVEKPQVAANAASLLRLVAPVELQQLVRQSGTGEGPRPVWDGALLHGLLLPGMYLSDLSWRRTNLRDANLAGGRWMRMHLEGANLEGVNLTGAHWVGSWCNQARLQRLRASGWRALRCDLSEVDLSGSDLRAARLLECNLRMAKLDRVDLSGAVLDRSNLSGASFASTNLTEARLRHAELPRVDLRTAVLNGLDLRHARLDLARLDGQRIDEINLEDAWLRRALLTGSSLRGAMMARTDLSEAGLADIDWEGADLRGADFTGAQFHLGTTRSGLLIGAPASWGTRTGFYTDDFTDRERKPEEIRKASLRKCDLRGAKVTGADFYLVDLRGVLCDEEQYQHFRKCGAILDRR